MTGPTARPASRPRRLVVLGAVLALTAVVVPTASVRRAPISLVKVSTASAVDHSPEVLWILALGSDARPGQLVTRSRADAIQLVGVNVVTGRATSLGIPRDSYVEIPGYGSNKINAALYFGGPQLMAQAVGNMVGLQPDYVFTTGFEGFTAMVRTMGGVTVYSKYAFSDPVRPQGYKVGMNRLTGFQAMIFARIRKAFPGGDFDRSANQAAVLKGILREVRANQDDPGFMERGVLSVVNNMDTNLRPGELYTLAQAMTRVEPAKFRSCVIGGSTGYVGAASVVFADVAQARRIADDARNDATLNGPC